MTKLKLNQKIIIHNIRRNNLVQIWELDTGKLNIHLLFSSDGRNLITIFSYYYNKNNVVKIWELETGKLVRLIEYESIIRSISLSSDILYILCGSEVWELKLKSWNHNLLWSQGCSQDWALWDNVMKLSPNGRYVVTSSEGNTVKVIDIRSGDQLVKIGGHRFPITDLDISPDGQYIITKSKDSLKIWELHSGNLKLTLKRETYFDLIKFSTTEQILVKIVNYNNIEVWDIATGKKIHILKGHTSFIRDLAVFNKYVISGSSDKTVKIWSLDSGQLLHTLNFDLSVNSVAIFPNGRFIASSSSDSVNSKIKIWEYKTGELLFDKWADGIINSISTSPSGDYLFSKSSKNAILWEILY